MKVATNHGKGKLKLWASLSRSGGLCGAGGGRIELGYEGSDNNWGTLTFKGGN